MIVKFLRPSTSFKGVGYSFAKMLLDKGELMQVKNFDALAGLTNPRAEDYVNYLEAVTGQSKRIVYPQLHVTISTKGRDHSKRELTDIAEKWLAGMGYAHQPYLIIFHKDTQNNHVHIVSTRIGRDGKKIRDSYEWRKGYEVLNEIMGLDVARQIQKDVSQALAYHISSRAQFMMLLEVKGYTLSLKNNAYHIFKFGKEQGNIPVEQVDKVIANYQSNKERIQQLRAFIGKYRIEYSPELFPLRSQLPGGGDGPVTGYSSELANALQQKFGLQFIFHAKDGKPPYGYTVIDHAQKTVYKGGQIMPLAEFIETGQSPVPKLTDPAINPTNNLYQPFAELLSENSGAASNGFLPDKAEANSASDYYHSETYIPTHYIPALRLDIADDIDDEQINGRNRRRKRKARTNTR